MNNLKQLGQLLLSVLILLGISLVHVPEVVRGDRISQGDKLHFIGGNNSLKLTHAESKKLPRWCDNMYAGMPATFIYPKYPSNLVYTILHSAFMPNELKLFFIPAFFVWLTLIVSGTGWLIALGSAVAYGFTTVVVGNIEAGHSAKVLAMGTVLPMLVGVHIAFRKKLLRAFIIVSGFTSINIACNHLQITYYTVLLVSLMVLAETCFLFGQNQGKHLARIAVVLLCSAVIGILPNASLLWSSYKYSSETVRGERILEGDRQGGDDGLSSASVFEYSYSVPELFSVVVPRIVGGSSNEYLDSKSHSYRTLRETGIEQQRIEDQHARVPLFWGDKPLNGAPSYLGVSFLFLFLISFWALQLRMKILVAILLLFTIVIMLGNNAGPIGQGFYNYLPLYSKFRAPSMAVGVFSAVVVLSLALGLQRILADTSFLQRESKKLLSIGVLLIVVLSVIGLLGPTMLSMNWEWGLEQSGISMDETVRRKMINYGYPEDSVNKFFRALLEDRAFVMQYDAFCSSLILLVLIVIVWLAVRGTLSFNVALLVIMLVGIVDVYRVNRHYLNERDFSSSLTFEELYPVTPSMNSIDALAIETDRVIDVSITNTWMDARPSYYFPSIGGMSSARLRRFQDLIDIHLNDELASIRAKNRFAATPVLNMLNARFIKTGDGRFDYLENVTAMGPGWFVDSVKWVSSSNEEVEALNRVNLATTAIVNEDFKANLKITMSRKPSFSTVRVLEKNPFGVVYETVSDVPRLLVLSEIWYKGNDYWKSTIDGKPANHIRANYALRAVEVPAGKHTVKFEYEDLAYERSEPIAAAGSGILIISLLMSGFALARRLSMG